MPFNAPGTRPNSVAITTSVSSRSVLSLSRGRRRGGKVAEQVRHAAVELIAANVVVRFRLVIEDVPVVVPVGMRDVDVAGAGVGHHEVAGQQAAEADLVFAVAGAFFLATSGRPAASAGRRESGRRTRLEIAEAAELAVAARARRGHELRRVRSAAGSALRAPPALRHRTSRAAAAVLQIQSSTECFGCRKPVESAPQPDGVQIAADVSGEGIVLAALRFSNS